MSTNSNKTQNKAPKQTKLAQGAKTPPRPASKAVAPGAPKKLFAAKTRSLAVPTRMPAGRQIAGREVATRVSDGTSIMGTRLRSGHLSHTSMAGGLRVTGTEYLGTIESANPQLAADPYMIISGNPLALGQRLPKIAANFQKFQFTKVEITYVPNIAFVNPDAKGTMIIATAFDPQEPLPPLGIVGDQVYASFKSNVMFNVNQEATSKLALENGSQVPLYVYPDGTDVRFDEQFYTVVAPVHTQPEDTYGDIYLTYTIELTQAGTNASLALPTLTANCVGMPLSEVTQTGGAVVFTTESKDASPTAFHEWRGDIPKFRITDGPSDNCAFEPGTYVFYMSHVNNKVLVTGYTQPADILLISGDADVSLFDAQTRNGPTGYYDNSNWPNNLVNIMRWEILVRTTSTFNFVMPHAPVAANCTVSASIQITDVTALQNVAARDVPLFYPRVITLESSRDEAVTDAFRAAVLRELVTTPPKSPEDVASANALIDAAELDIPHYAMVTNTCNPIVVGAATVGAWFLKEFGAKIAAHLVGMGKAALERYFSGKTIVKRDRRNRPR